MICLIGWMMVAVWPAGAQEDQVCSGFDAEEKLRVYHEVDFADVATFHICLLNDPQLEEALLEIEVFDRAEPIDKIIPAAENAQLGDLINVNFPLDLASELVPPFTLINYTWTLQYADEPQKTLSTESFFYTDDSVAWENTASEDGLIQIYSESSDIEIALQAIEILEESRPDILSYLPDDTDISEPIDVYLYPSTEQFLTTLRLTGLDWIVGKATPEIGVMMVPLGNREQVTQDIRQRLPHELAHLLLYRAAGDSYERFPAWMDEGFATQFEKPVNANYAQSLATVNNSTQLIPFREMCVNLPVQPPEMSLRGYAQSHAVVGYLLQEDPNAIQAVLEQTLAGESCIDAIEKGLEKTSEQIAEDWINHIQPQFPDPESPVWIAIGILAALFLIIILVLWSRTDNTRTLGDFNR